MIEIRSVFLSQEGMGSLCVWRGEGAGKGMAGSRGEHTALPEGDWRGEGGCSPPAALGVCG